RSRPAIGRRFVQHLGAARSGAARHQEKQTDGESIMADVKQAERLTVKLNDIAFQGPAVGRVDGWVVFADFGIPGEEVVVEIDKSRRQYTSGKVVEVLTPAP